MPHHEAGNKVKYGKRKPKNQQGEQGITPYDDVTGLRTTGKDGKVNRPMNAFMLWAKTYRKELISKG
jgi:hypothetical protein